MRAGALLIAVALVACERETRTVTITRDPAPPITDASALDAARSFPVGETTARRAVEELSLSIAVQRREHLPRLAIDLVDPPPPGCGAADTACVWQFSVYVPANDETTYPARPVEVCNVHAHTGEVVRAHWIALAQGLVWTRVGNAFALPSDAGTDTTP